MSAPVRPCVVIPVYNHGLTIQQVAEGARDHLPVLVVNDGSTDTTAERLAAVEGIRVLTLPVNQGKGAALRAGFAEALALGYTHAITVDADGQHATDALPQFVAACAEHPAALVVGVRDFVRAGAPKARRWSNALSTFWFRVETGVPLTDTQCGYRAYPLGPILAVPVASHHYAYELEIMVRAAWAGMPLIPLPIETDYAAPTSRLSHFRPLRDFFRIGRVHSRLCMQAFMLPAALRSLLARGALRGLPRKHRWRTILRLLFTEHTETPARLAAAIGLGLFCGIAPIWGYQMVVAALLAHKFRLNKAVALTASNISFPLAAPFILAAGLALGHFLRTGQLVDVSADTALRQIPQYLWDWVLGSVVLALLVGVLGYVGAYLIARISFRPPPEPPPST